jgi:Protein of unknown function (DUF1592)/Protein of unknown function (DUF1588)/Protein of unknown function (DUF1585)/Protein of unknown function (DUF1595)/Protein of unknown function (DUF1587)/Planctomycete cytochrome C
MTNPRLILVVGAIACVLSGTAAPTVAQPTAPAVPPDYGQSARPVLQRYCYECHGAQKQKAHIRYDQLAGYRKEDRNLWAKVHEQVSSGGMPPDDHPQPSAHERALLLGWIEGAAAAARRAHGAGGTRRLNRRELSAALQDVTGLTVDYAASLPGDGKLAGFDTGADALQDAADSVSQVMTVARRAVDGIRFLSAAPGEPLVGDFVSTPDPKKRVDGWKKKLGVDVNGFRTATAPKGQPPKIRGLLLEPRWVGDRDAMTVSLPAPPDGRGVLRLKLVASGFKPVPGVPNSRLWVEVAGRDVDYHEVTGTFEEPEELVYEVQVDDLPMTKGLKVSLTNKVEVPYAVEGYPNDEQVRESEPAVLGGTGLFRPKFDRKLPPEQQPVPWVVLHRIEVDTNHVAAWPPPNWGIDIGKLADDEASAKRLLSVWVERAWRRPAAEAEQARFLELYRKLRGQGMSFDDALRPAFQAVLLSSHFRYLPSPAAAGDDPSARQYATASRLSFMLWGAPLDAELRRLAAAGKLRDPAVLDAQVDRLLADPRSDAFVRPFVTQWLEMEQPITVAMDHIKQQDFRWGRHLKASMREETVQYVARLLAENRPAADLVASDWTLMNDILARHYGYAGVEGGQLRKVTLRPDDPRGGGILGHAGIQSMLCWMGENWVIYRGAWALRHVLDDPPPPPPLEVPELTPSRHAGKSFRELLRQHQADPNCAVCHTKMDPLGFAFQNFDLSGRWREVEFDKYVTSELDGKIEWRGSGNTRPVDAAGRLPRGEDFKDYAEFKQLLVRNYRRDVVRGLMRNWTIYATGRQPDVADMAEIRAVMKANEAAGYPLRDMLKALLRSKLFLE